MKPKPKKKQPTNNLGITREIRNFFREREVKRIERYKTEIINLRGKLKYLERDNFDLRNSLFNLKSGVRKLLE